MRHYVFVFFWSDFGEKNDQFLAAPYLQSRNQLSGVMCFSSEILLKQVRTFKSIELH